jgi:hypothetical protein
MRINDAIYFAPGVRFEQIDFRGPALPDQFAQRIEGFYLRPAEILIAHRAAFGAGLLLVCAVDALGKFRNPGLSTGKRFKNFARNELPSFSAPGAADDFYEAFRNGIVHEARVKRGSQFTLDTDATVVRRGKVMILNPQLLLREVWDALRKYCALLKSNPVERNQLAVQLRKDHAKDPK